MFKISDIVQIAITRQTTAVAQANFGIILLAVETDSADPEFSGRVKSYSGDILAGMVEDGFITTTDIYKAATKILMQNPSVDQIKVGLKFTGATADANWTDALNAIFAEDPDFYGLSIMSSELADQKLAADWAETKKILFGISSDAEEILDPDLETDIAFYIKDNNYDRSFVYFFDTGGEFIAEAAMGERFPKNPGSGTWKFKTLAGITANKIDANDRVAALEKNANIYVRRAGVSMTEDGTVGSGEFIDVIRGLDWLESEIEVSIYSQLINVEKIPFTDEGITIIVGLLRGALDRAVQRGIITEEYVISAPDVGDVSFNDRANRILPDIEFTATLQGAIHSVKISGTVSI